MPIGDANGDAYGELQRELTETKNNLIKMKCINLVLLRELKHTRMERNALAHKLGDTGT